MTKKEMKRTIIFAILVSVLCYASYRIDSEGLFAYVPYWLALLFCLAILLPFLPKGPWLIKITVLVLFSGWLLLLLPKIRSSETKAFFVDAWSIRKGMTVAQVDSIMAKYEKNPIFYAGVTMSGVKESQSEHSSRILYVNKDHHTDWCVVYPRDAIVRRIVVFPD
jgi:hypothetical protein